MTGVTLENSFPVDSLQQNTRPFATPLQPNEGRYRDEAQCYSNLAGQSLTDFGPSYPNGHGIPIPAQYEAQQYLGQLPNGMPFYNGEVIPPDGITSSSSSAGLPPSDPTSRTNSSNSLPGCTMPSTGMADTRLGNGMLCANGLYSYPDGVVMPFSAGLIPSNTASYPDIPYPYPNGVMMASPAGLQPSNTVSYTNGSHPYPDGVIMSSTGNARLQFSNAPPYPQVRRSYSDSAIMHPGSSALFHSSNTMPYTYASHSLPGAYRHRPSFRAGDVFSHTAQPELQADAQVEFKSPPLVPMSSTPPSADQQHSPSRGVPIDTNQSPHAFSTYGMKSNASHGNPWPQWPVACGAEPSNSGALNDNHDGPPDDSLPADCNELTMAQINPVAEQFPYSGEYCFEGFDDEIYNLLNSYDFEEPAGPSNSHAYAPNCNSQNGFPASNADSGIFADLVPEEAETCYISTNDDAQSNGKGKMKQ